MQHSHPTLASKLLILFPPTLFLLPLHPHHRLTVLAVSLYLLLSLPLHNSLRVLQWNAGGLRARSTKLLHFISSHPVNLIYIQESNLNLSSSFRIPGFSALQSHGTHSRSGIFSTDVTDASGCVIIFVKQGLFFSKLSTSSLSLLGPYSDYVEVNISLNNSSSLSFLNVYVPPIRSSTKDSRTNFFSFSILPHPCVHIAIFANKRIGVHFLISSLKHGLHCRISLLKYGLQFRISLLKRWLHFRIS